MFTIYKCLRLKCSHENKRMQLPLPILTRSSFVISITWPILVTPATWKAPSNKLNLLRKGTVQFCHLSHFVYSIEEDWAQFLSSTSSIRLRSNKMVSESDKGKMSSLYIQRIQMLFQCKERNVLSKTICFHLFLVYENHSKRVKFWRMKKNSWA